MKRFAMAHPVMTAILGISAVGTLGTIIIAIVEASAKPAAAPPATTTATTPQLETGHTYRMVAPMPAGISDGVVLGRAFTAAGWTNITINSTTGSLVSDTGTVAAYDVTATRGGPSIDVPSGVTATLIS